jgi:spore coat polysaccharide biosynthesis protein SpsF (cytidylyltransferase family)
MKRVCIGIQARSTSSRFPNKVFEVIAGKEMLRHVVDAVDKCAFYLNRNSHRSGVEVSHVILCPKGDPIKAKYETRTAVMEGPEDDVLTRYYIMANRMDADYIVRITGDCPLVPPYLISKHIKVAIANEYDYCSNVDEGYRTAIDGYDVEVVSRRALEWANENAKEPRDREHVTTILRTQKFTESFKCGLVVNFLNQSHVKLSVDTLDDLEAVRVESDRVNKNIEKARAKFGRNHVHQI